MSAPLSELRFDLNRYFHTTKHILPPFSQNNLLQHGFFDIVRELGLDLQEHALYDNPRSATPLYLQSVVSHPEDKGTLIGLIAGVHGLWEGEIGAAAELVFLDHFARSLPGNVGYFVLQGLNTTGSVEGTRFTGGNIDINRACLDHANDFSRDTKLDRIFEETVYLHTPDVSSNEHRQFIRFLWRARRALRDYGRADLFTALSTQYTHPQSPFYAGTLETRPREVDFLREFVRKHTQDYDRFILLDLHAGLAPKGGVVISTEHAPEGDVFRCLDVRLPVSLEDANVMYPVKGSVEAYCGGHSLARKYEGATVELGGPGRTAVTSMMEAFRATVALNCVRELTYASREPELERFREIFSPTDNHSRREVLNNAYVLFDSLVKSLR